MKQTTESSLQEEQPLIARFPIEVLHFIIKLLPPKQVFKCREVCRWWKLTVDDLLTSNIIWTKLCNELHSSVFDEARMKCDPNLRHNHLHKFLRLWPEMTHARETWNEFAHMPAHNKLYQIRKVHAWKGLAAVHLLEAIVYYNLETSLAVQIIHIGPFHMFEENDDLMVYMKYVDYMQSPWFRTLKIVPKLDQNCKFGKALEIDNVNNYIIVGNDLYYNKWTRPGGNQLAITEVYVCKLKENYECKLIASIDRSVWAFGYNNNRLNYLTIDSTIFSLVDDKFVLTDSFENDCFYKLAKYNLLERANFGACITDAYSTVRRIDYLNGLTVRTFHNIALVGNKQGILNIYNLSSLYLNKHTNPIKRYNLKALFQLKNPCINGIDVKARENGHVVLVSTPGKIIALNMLHCEEVLTKYYVPHNDSFLL